MDIPLAANALGITGAICWSIQLIPQIVINYRRHDTAGLQPTMMLLWAGAGVPLGVYNIVSSFNIALRIQPQILTMLSLITWTQCQYYGSKKWPLAKGILVASLLAIVMGAVEYILIFALLAARDRALAWPSTLMAVLSAVLLSAGVLRHYWDIYKERTVRGISFLFVGLDALGDLTSLLSIVFQPDLDVQGMVIYGCELVLWVGIMACGGYFNLRPWLTDHMRARLMTEQHSGSGGDNEHRPTDDYASTGPSRSSSTVFRTAAAGAEHPVDSLPSVRLRTIPTATT